MHFECNLLLGANQNDLSLNHQSIFSIHPILVYFDTKHHLSFVIFICHVLFCSVVLRLFILDVLFVFLSFNFTIFPLMMMIRDNSDEPRDLCPLYRPGEWEELPSERDLNPFSRYEALGAPNRPIVLDDIESAVSEISESQIADKSPSDEGFTELELLQSDSNTTCSGHEGASLQEHRKTPTRISMDQKDKSLRSFNAEEEEDEDEGLHNRSTDDNMDLLRSLVHDGKEAATEVTKTSGETLVNGVFAIENDQRSKVTPEDSGKCSPPGPHVEDNTGPNADEELLSEAEKRRRASEAEMKSWLVNTMQRPIEGEFDFD